jgi:uncharacterized membrane protein
MEKIINSDRWFLPKARQRILCAVVTGVAAFFLLNGHHPSTRFLMAWSAASGIYILLAHTVMNYFNKKKISHLCNHQDDGEYDIYIISLLASMVSLVAIFIHIGGMCDIPLHERVLGVVITGVTFFTSWLVLHTAFAMHYARAYFSSFKDSNEFPPLIFTGKKLPNYTDFFHFSIVIGMTCQTADIVIVDSNIRRLVTTHSLLAFIFNATLLGLTINLIGGLLT